LVLEPGLEVRGRGRRKEGGREGGRGGYLKLRRACIGRELVENNGPPQRLHALLHSSSVVRVAHVNQGQTLLPQGVGVGHLAGGGGKGGREGGKKGGREKGREGGRKD